MWLVLASLFFSTAHADDRDCVTKDYAWRVHTTDNGSSWRIVHSGEVLTDKGELDVTWHDDTKKAFNSTNPSQALFAIEATVKKPDGEERLDLRCAASASGSAPPPAKAKAAAPPAAAKTAPPPAKAPPAKPATPAPAAPAPAAPAPAKPAPAKPAPPAK